MAEFTMTAIFAMGMVISPAAPDTQSRLTNFHHLDNFLDTAQLPSDQAQKG
jgi:hypothetical protein